MPPARAIGASVGPYKIERALGQGATGDVYAARDMRTGGRVALKVLAAHVIDSAAVRRELYAEGLLAGSIDHPGICAIHEIGEADGHAFVAMELVDGLTLHDYARQQALSPARVLDLAMQLASALDAAHRHGVVHRDLNSRNILVDDAGRATILDFGLALRTGTGPRWTPAVGSADYASPEQVTGLALDARSDLFSLGVVLHELLTGRLPFQGENRTELFRAIVNNPAMPVARLNEHVPVALSNVVGRLLAKNRDRRFQSAAEVLAALRRIDRPAVLSHGSRMFDSKWFPRLAGSAAGVVFAVGALFPASIVLSYEAEAALRSTTTRQSGVWTGLAASRSLEAAVVSAERPDAIWIGDDGRLVYSSIGPGGQSIVWSLGPADATPRMVAAGAVAPSVAARGDRLVFAGQYDQGLYTASGRGTGITRIGEHRVTSPWLLADGTVLFRDAVTGVVQLAPLDGSPARPVTGHPIDGAPFVSADGRRLAFERGGQTVVCDLPVCTNEVRMAMRGLRGWAPGGRALAFAGRPGGANVWLAPLDGGSARQATWFDDRTVSSVAWSPDGRRVAVTRVMTLSDLNLLPTFR